ncbi:MAG: hypothetical protein N2322_07085, partial [Terrimicrobiaceae bacterium]|nr:hypothetical protein [Terrimicrobiaceae bacterium]
NAKEAAGHVVIAPPGASSGRALAAIRQRKSAALTGWALDPGAAFRLGVDAAIPISDHADYDELIEHVEAVGPSRVLTLHGFAADFARDLRARGIEAWALTGPDQLEWDAMAPPPRARPPVSLPPLAGRGFDAFAQLCEDIRQSTGRSRKIELLAAAMRRLETRSLRSTAVWLTGRPFASASGRVLHAGVRVIHEALAKASGAPVAEIRALAREDNDTGKTVTSVLSGKELARGVRSMAEVAAFFEALASAKGPLAKIELLARALGGMHPVSAGYLVRILTGNLRIGLKEGLVEEALACAFGTEPEVVRSAAMMAGDLGAVAALASANRLDEARLALFQPARCMLASPESGAESAWERLGASGRVWTEPKLDGLRAQAHCGGGQAEIFSRDLRPLSDTFPEITAALAALPFRAIFDGEIL